MLVSIIICTHNRAPDLTQTLEVLRQIEIPAGLSSELLVIDNASIDSTSKIVQSFVSENLKVRYCYEPRTGKGHAYNTGIESARGDILLFTDDDVRPPKNWIAGMCASIIDGTAHAVAGGVKLAPHLERPWMGLGHRSWLASSDGLDAQNPAGLIGANMSFSRQVLEKVPCFDPELGPGALGFYDETLFALQLKEAGYVITSALHAAVEHHFDVNRLQRHNFLSLSRKQGQSAAYVAHHWEHKVINEPHKHLLQEWWQLLYWRLKKRQECRMNEGIPWWELYMVRDLHFYRQYLIERKRKRNYELRGLVKLRL